MLSGHMLKAQVISHDPEKDGVYVQLASGQKLGYPVQRLYPVADGLRISKPPLPVRGSWVMISFSGGDMRNGIMMGAFHPNLNDAIPNAPGDPFSHYDSHYSGHWHHMDGMSGFVSTQFADTSSFVMGSGSLNLPMIFRHKVDENQQQMRIPFTQQDRNPKPQQPFGWKYSQAVSGGMGGLTCSTDVSGNFNVTNSASGKTGSFSFGGTTIHIDANGNANIDLGGGKLLNMTQGGGAASDFLTLVSKLVIAFNSHTHGNVMSGGDITSTPTSPWSADTVRSAIIHISN